MEYILRTEKLCKNYGRSRALNGLDMNVPKGAIYGFVGRNGAGKTTLIRMICSLQYPSSGTFELYGVKNTDPKFGKAARRMGAVVETPSIHLNMSAEANLKQQHILLGLPSYDDIPEILKLVRLSDTGNKPAKNFSLGMKQRLGIAMALCGDPDLLILDEPINGLDPQGIVEIRELILKLNREREITFIISSHILDELSRLATHYGFIDDGRIVREMSAEELEQTTRKSVRINVDDTGVLSRVLDEMGFEYKILDGNNADIYGKPHFSTLAQALAKENCSISSMQEHDESLEGFYMSLVGGDRNA
ncbi:MAG: ABC transporter ATP-binding protein [Oscillospiraceae bacterium]|nr:ABC transporter ATP-binding protein [Oscillospiraceae bacterium]